MTTHESEKAVQPPKRGKKTKQVPAEQRIGSTMNYIVLNPKTAKRPLLEKWMPDMLHTADFARHKRKNADKVNYTLNLISVPELDIDALKLGLFLFWYCEDNSYIGEDDCLYYETDSIFSISDAEVRNSKFGENETVFIGRPKTAKSEAHAMPFKSLPYMLKANGVKLNNTQLLPLLNILHNYGFLTLTPINKDNCLNKNIDDYDTGCVHIALNLGAITARINRKWNDTPSEPKN